MKNELTKQISRLNDNLEQIIEMVKTQPTAKANVIGAISQLLSGSVGPVVNSGLVLGVVSEFVVPEYTADAASSAISKISYNKHSRNLMVTFRKSGKTYCYQSVPASEYEAFVSADSIGRFHNKEIKNQYQCSEVQ